MIIFSIREAHDGALFFVMEHQARTHFTAWHPFVHKERDGTCPPLTIVERADVSTPTCPFAREVWVARGRAVCTLRCTFTGGQLVVRPAQGAWFSHTHEWKYPLEPNGDVSPAWENPSPPCPADDWRERSRLDLTVVLRAALVH